LAIKLLEFLSLVQPIYHGPLILLFEEDSKGEYISLFPKFVLDLL
jgi:hypothetical protein